MEAGEEKTKVFLKSNEWLFDLSRKEYMNCMLMYLKS